MLRAHLFLADDPVAPVGNTSRGLSTPRDTILTGKVASRLSSSVGFVKLLSGAPLPRNGNHFMVGSSSGDKTAEQLKEDLLASPAGPILGELITAMADRSDFGAKTMGVLERYGYGNLTDEDFCKLLYTTPGAIMASGRAQSLMTGSKTDCIGRRSLAFSAGSIFDIRAFGAIYAMTAPQGEKQKLVVNPQTGLIFFDGVESKSTETLDPNGDIWVGWTTAINEYRVKFSSVLNPDTGVITFSFAGTATPHAAGGKAITFTGSQYVPIKPSIPFDIHSFGAIYDITQPETEVGKQLIVKPNTGLITYDGVDSTPSIETDAFGKVTVLWGTTGKNYSVAFTSSLKDKAFITSFTGSVADAGRGPVTFSGTQYISPDSDNPWGLATPKRTSISELIGFGLGFVGLIGFGLSIWWRIKDTRAKPAEDKKLIKDMTEKMHEKSGSQFARILKGFEAIAGQQAQEESRNNTIEWPDFSPTLDRETADIVKSRVDALSNVELEALPADFTGQAWEALFSAANKRVSDSLTSFAHEQGLAPIADALGPWADAGFLTDGKITELAQKALSPQINRRIQALTAEGAGDGTAYAKSMVIDHVLTRRVDIREDTIRKLEISMGQLDLLLQQTQEEKSNLERQIELEREKIKDEKDPDRKIELGKEVERLEAALESRVEEETRIDSENREQERQAKEARDRNQEEEDKADRAREEAKERKERALEHE